MYCSAWREWLYRVCQNQDLRDDEMSRIKLAGVVSDLSEARFVGNGKGCGIGTGGRVGWYNLG